MISVIIPTYRRAEKLRKALASIKNQTYKNWEVIVVSDGPSEAAEKVTDSFENTKYMELSTRTNNWGQTPRNEGFKHAKGDLIAYLDDDNIFKPWTLELYYECMKIRDEDIAYGDPELYTNGKMTGVRVFPFDEKALRVSPFIDASCMVIRRKVLEKVKWDASGDYRGDWLSQIRWLDAGYRFVHIPYTTLEYYYR